MALAYSSDNNVASNGIARRMQGVQHFGITVEDMKRSLEFYVDILGGKVAIMGTGFYGPILHNTMFQAEEIQAITEKRSARSLGVPDVRDGSREALDVCFLSFGNTSVELIHFRDARLDASAPNIMPRVPSCVGYGNACHISFHVKDDVDLNVFAKDLEEECRKRGFDNVVVNHVIDVRSHEERRNLPEKYAANKFCDEGKYFIEGYSDANFGEFEGWSLFYCKGPNGEQLEFNQVIRKAKVNFDRARQEYNDSTGNTFEAPQPLPEPAMSV